MLNVLVSDGSVYGSQTSSVGMVLRLSGSLEMSTADDLERWLEATARLADHLLLDLSEVDFVDSAGLRVLLVASQRDARLTLLNVRPDVRLTFEMSGVAHLLDPGA